MARYVRPDGIIIYTRESSQSGTIDCRTCPMLGADNICRISFRKRNVSNGCEFGLSQTRANEIASEPASMSTFLKEIGR